DDGNVIERPTEALHESVHRRGPRNPEPARGGRPPLLRALPRRALPPGWSAAGRREIGTACAPPAIRMPRHPSSPASDIASRNIDEDQVSGSGADPAFLLLGIRKNTLARGARHQGVEHAIAVHVTAQPALDGPVLRPGERVDLREERVAQRPEEF